MADGFLGRWAKRKEAVRQGKALPAEPQAKPAAPAEGAAATMPAPATQASAPVAEPPPAPTLEEAQALTPESDFRRFAGAGVDPQVKNAAMKKLFADPHFNVMDGLDTYIDDYGKPDPLPAGMLRKMAQAKFLGLFDDEDGATAAPDLAAGPAPAASKSEAPAPDPLPHEDTDLRLQPHDAARCAGAEPGPGQDGGGER